MGRLRKALLLLTVLVLIAGLCVLLYPCFNGWLTDRSIQKEAEGFFTALETIPPTDPSTPPGETEPQPTQPAILYPELLEAMQQYNRDIWEQRQSGLSDPWAYTQPSFELEDYGVENEIFGVISIPKLDLEMPIYLGATYQHLADGAAHLSQTSIPIGGENTNAVIAGHRGWNGASYFRYITQLQPGDEVIITNLWGALHYRVAETKIIDPNDVEDILIQENQELLTLLTCHPYASGGKQRYVVYCERNYEMEETH